MQIIVLGMHRSGTSVATRLVNMLGASLGPEEALMPVSEDNPKGFWERTDVQVLNDDILRARGGTWHRCGALTPWSNLDPEQRADFEERARAIVAELDQAPNWVLKDPRLCLTFPLWRPLLDRPAVLTVFRPPVQTAQSLKHRNGLPLSAGLALWEAYSAQGLADSAGLHRCFIHFHDLLADPRGFLSGLLTWLEGLGATGLALPGEAAVTSFVDKRLVHHRDETQAMATRCTPHQAGLYEAMRMAGPDTDPPNFAVSDHAMEILAEYEAVERDRNRLEERRKALAKTRQGLAETREKLRQATRSKHEAQRTADRLKDSATKAVALQRMVAEKNHHIFLLTERAREHHEHGHRMMAELERSFRDAERLHASMRWRLGSAAVSIAQVTLRKPSTATALDHIRSVRDNYLVWRDTALTARAAMPSATTVPMDKETRLHIASFAIQLEERTRRADDLRTQCKHRATEVRQLEEWLGQVLDNLIALEQSLSWRVGDIPVSLVETLLLRRRNATVFNHVREVREALQRWRTDVPTGLPALPGAIPSGKTLSVDLGAGQQYVDTALWGGDTARARPGEDDNQSPAQGRARPRLRTAVARGTARATEGETASGLLPVEHAPSPLAHVLMETQEDTGRDIRLVDDTERERLAATLAKLPQGQVVNVVMPAWNRAATISGAVRSVQAQVYANWRLDVVDDGSDDDTVAVVRNLAREDPRIRIHQIEHRGVSTARNFGLLQADGEYVAYLDSDNTWDPDYLLFMVNALEATNAQCAYCGLRLVNEDTGETSIFARRFHYRNLLRNNFIDINIFMHRRDLASRIGRFDTQLKRWVDWDLIIRFVADMDPLMMPFALCDYTISSTLRQITYQESDAFKNKVLTKYLVDWSPRPRTPGHTTIVIPVYDAAELTRACIESIQRHTRGPFDVLVVDNGCTDHTPQVLAELEARYPNMSHVSNYENYGFALGCNVGVGAARGEYVVLLNNDTTVTPGWLEPLLAPLQPGAGEPEAVGIVGPKLLFPDDTLQCGGIVFSHKSKIPYHVYQHRAADDPVVNKRRVFQALSGACMAMRADDFLALKGFDPVFLNGCEDIDFCFHMVRDLGKACLYEPASVVYHYEGKTEGRGKNIMYNRELLVARWQERITPDDFRYYADDGLKVVKYTKKGAEPHGDTAAYYPELVPFGFDAAPDPEPDDVVDVAVCAMWHERGITFHARQLARALEHDSPDTRFRTHVFARWESDRFSNAGPVLHPRVTNAGDDPSAEETVRWARERDIGLWIQMEVHPKDWKRIEALQEAGIRVVGYENLDILRTAYMDRYARFDALLSSALYTNAFFAEQFPDVPRLCIPWGVPPELPLLSTTTRFDNRLTFVHVAGWGGVNNRKNSTLLVRAFHKAGMDNAVLRLFTQNPVSALGKDVADIVATSPHIVTTEGTVPDIFEAYAGADMLLWPSKREGLGLPILEALACGVPCLISDGWMMKQWVVPGEHGMLCPATPEQGMMHLPEMRVDEDTLVDMIRELASRPDRLAEFKARVRRDREQWLWTWQPTVFREQIGRLARDSAYRPADDLSYLPSSVLAFERRRLKAGQVQRAGT